MREYLYPEGIEQLRDPALQRVVHNLHKEIGSEFQLWIRVEDFARRISIGVLNARHIAAILIVARCGQTCPGIDARVLGKIRGHLHSPAEGDLTISLL